LGVTRTHTGRRKLVGEYLLAPIDRRPVFTRSGEIPGNTEDSRESHPGDWRVSLHGMGNPVPVRPIRYAFSRGGSAYHARTLRADGRGLAERLGHSVHEEGSHFILFTEADPHLPKSTEKSGKPLDTLTATE